MSIFPFYDYEPMTLEELPLYYEVAWDAEKNQPFIENGDFKIVSGLDAVKSWILRTIQTERYAHEIYTWNHASELRELIGKPFNSLSRAEAARIVKDTLRVNPYITNVEVSSVDFFEGALSLDVVIETIYGNVKEVLSV